MMTSICKSSRQACTLFDRLSRAVAAHQLESRSTEAPVFSSKDIEDEFERYRLWAGSLGAFHPSDDTRSLDYRLRDAATVRKRALELLGELCGLLSDGTYAITVVKSARVTTSDSRIQHFCLY